MTISTSELDPQILKPEQQAAIAESLEAVGLNPDDFRNADGYIAAELASDDDPPVPPGHEVSAAEFAAIENFGDDED